MGDCIAWQGAIRNSKGYGQITVKGRKYLAHRVVYEKAHGPLPAGLVVRHRCDNPRCVNPEHLEVGTQADNMADCAKRGRQFSVLTAEQVVFIRNNYKPRCPEFGGTALARRFGVSPATVSMALNRRNWKHDL